MPLVSIIVPCYNEQDTIHLLLEAICAQTISSQDMEVIVADGLSTDQTRAVIAAFQQSHPDLTVRLVDNPRRNIPSGLNRALSAAQGQFIVRLDAHSVPAVDYVERCLENLRAGRGENIGGVWEIQPRGVGRMARAIAIAAAHPFGVGDALYRYTTRAGLVDTVPFGAFRRDVFERYGHFDESLLTNEDYEFNARLRQGGGRVWLDPRVRSIYFARPDLKALSRQYWRYGFWKYRMLRRYPQTLRWRQGLPPLFVLGLLALLALSLWSALARITLGLVVLAYFSVLKVAAVPAARRLGDWFLVPAVALAIATMHVCWGAGFLWSILSSLAERPRAAV